ncbi:MAG: chemotaxis protein CheR, partial [Leptospiraceae bacterium]|nr:chemotaxis protein CheR [Leptospiraceae bacterium]
HCEVLTLIRDLITFRVLNLVRDNFPFKGRFDIIFLRNVLIYFEDKVKVQLLNQLNELMVDGGVLFIGQTESFPQSISSLQTIYPSVFCKGELG